MSAMGDQLRAKSKELADATELLAKTPEYATDHDRQSLVTVGRLRSAILRDLAEVVDYLRSVQGVDSAVERRKALLKRNDEIRKAAARGDWGKFDELVSGFGTDAQ